MDGSIEIDSTYLDGARFIVKMKAPLLAPSHPVDESRHTSEIELNMEDEDDSNSINVDINPRIFRPTLMSPVTESETAQEEEFNFL